MPQTTLIRLLKQYIPNDTCEKMVARFRWPFGILCVNCAHREVSVFPKGKRERRTVFECRLCGQQFSPISGTLFHSTHLPLIKWLFAVYLLSGQRTVRATQL